MLTKKIRLFIYKIPWVYTFLAKSWRLINRGGGSPCSGAITDQKFLQIKKRRKAALI